MPPHDEAISEEGTSAAGSDTSVTIPSGASIPSPSALAGDEDATGHVVWHREHLRTDDHLALATALDRSTMVCPLFVFDPSFYDDEGLACDARLRFLHEAVASLDRLYEATPPRSLVRADETGRDRLADASRLVPKDRTATGDDLLTGAETPGLTIGYGDPVTVLSRFVDAGWSVVTMAAPTSRYGARRDERVRSACGDAVEFVSGDGLVRGQEWTRDDWGDQLQSWLEATQHAPDWDGVTRLAFETGVTPAAIDEAFAVEPTKTKVPTGTHRAAAEQLHRFVDRVPAYPRHISAPQDAREGTSGLSPYLNFGLLSVRQAYQFVTEHALDCRGREMFTDRLVWNRHYNQKLADWSGWTERAVNPVLEGLNEDAHDPELVTAWKAGETGFPMVDASMRCLRGTGWLNFRMRAMCASFFTHILQQPWWIGADWYHHHLVDSDVGINYTQWQSQAGLIGKPSQRVYNPRKQVRDQDPEGEWIREWVPELAALPDEFLDRPERAPLSVQESCGVRIGEDYPRPVVDFEARREAFWSRYERLQPAAARALARPAIAKRASFSGGYEAAKRIAAEYGDDAAPETQLSLSDLPDDTGGKAASTAMETVSEAARDSPTSGDAPLPTGAGEQAGEPSPDDRAAAGGQDSDEADAGTPPEAGTDQTELDRFD